MSTEIEKLTQILRYSNNIAFFGGAGVSTESGIPDFRSSNGLWNEKLKINFTPEQLVSHTFFMRYPEEFFRFYKDAPSFRFHRKAAESQTESLPQRCRL